MDELKPSQQGSNASISTERSLTRGLSSGPDPRQVSMPRPDAVSQPECQDEIAAGACLAWMYFYTDGSRRLQPTHPGAPDKSTWARWCLVHMFLNFWALPRSTLKYIARLYRETLNCLQLPELLHPVCLQHQLFCSHFLTPTHLLMLLLIPSSLVAITRYQHILYGETSIVRILTHGLPA